VVPDSRHARGPATCRQSRRARCVDFRARTSRAEEPPKLRGAGAYPVTQHLWVQVVDATTSLNASNGDIQSRPAAGRPWGSLDGPGLRPLGHLKESGAHRSWVLAPLMSRISDKLLMSPLPGRGGSAWENRRRGSPTGLGLRIASEFDCSWHFQKRSVSLSLGA
jgi:hypothetical protein